MAALPPDHAKLLMKRLALAKGEASRIGATLAASLIGMAILSINPTLPDGQDDPVARNDNRSQSDQG